MLSITSLFGKDAPILHQTNFQLLLVATLPPVLGTALVSPILDSLIGPFGASPANIGWMISSITAPGIVLIPMAGLLADRFGRKVVLIVSIVLFGSGGVAIAFTTDFQIVLLLRLVQGIGLAGINPIIITSIGDLYADGEEETGQGLRFMVSGLSGAIFPVFAGLLVVFAWQYPFLMYVMAFPIAAAVYLWFDEPTAVPPSDVTDGGDLFSYTRALFGLTRQRPVLAMVVARTLMSAVYIGFLTYNSLIVVRLLGGTPLQAGILASVLFFTFATSASQAGRITSAFESRLYPLLGGNVSLGLGFAIVLLAPGIGTATVGTLAIGVGFGIMGTLYRSIITDLAPEEHRAGLVGISEAGGRITNTLIPLVMGGVITILSPTVGLGAALQTAGFVVALLGAGGGIICLLVASISAPVSMDGLETSSG